MRSKPILIVALQLALLGCGSAQKCPDQPVIVQQQAGPAATTSTGAPAPTTPNQAPPGVFHVEVAKDGSLSIEGQAVPSLQDLADRARASAKSRPDLLLVVAADNDTPFSKVLAAFETAKRAGFQRAIIAEGTRVPHTATAKPAQSVPQLVTGDSFKCEVHQHIEGLDKKSAFIAIHVGPDGVAQTVDILEDPGAGLGDIARQCAMAQSYRPAVDAAGKPTTGVKKLRIFFQETH